MKPLDHVATIEKVKVGQWVFDGRYGWLRVKEIRTGATHPICTERVSTWDSLYADYMTDGKLAASDKNPCLFLIDIFQGTSPPAPEIDWSKVPQGTLVQGSHNAELWTHELGFITYAKGAHRPFVVRESDDVLIYKHCRLAPSVLVNPEWVVK